MLGRDVSVLARIFITLLLSTGVRFHDFRFYLQNVLTNSLACFSPIIKDSRVLTVIRGRSSRAALRNAKKKRDKLGC